MHVKILLTVLCSIYISIVSPVKIPNDYCTNGKLILSQCRCKMISNLATPRDYEARLECNGNDAIKVLTKALQFLEDPSILTELSVTSSNIENLKRTALIGFKDLKLLDLSKNNIKEIDALVFSSFDALEILDLSGNKMVMIQKELFMFLKHLKNLTLADNEIASIDAEAFQQLNELVYLDLSKNSLYHVESNWFSTDNKLSKLNVANNEIFAVQPDSFENLLYLRKLDLSDNKLEELSQPVFFRLAELVYLSLANNNLRTLNEDIFIGNKLLDLINLTGNLWNCDRKLLPLSDWLKTHEMDKSLCSEPAYFKNYTLQHALLNIYLEMKLEESPICNQSMCNCTVSKDKQVITVDCSSRGLTKIPESVPYKTRSINLTDNLIESLNMNHVNLTQWADVSFLHLSNNQIASLQGLEGHWILRHLVALHLNNNQLTDIPIHILEQFRGGLLDELYLEGNPWNCDCNTVRFQTWLQDNYKTVKDYHRLRCSPKSGVYSNHLIGELLKSQLCPQDVQLINYLDVLNGLMAVAIVLIVIKLSYDYWLQKRTGKLPRFFSLNI